MIVPIRCSRRDCAAVVPWLLVALLADGSRASEAGLLLPVAVGRFDQQVHTPFTVTDGLPADDATQIVVAGDGAVYANTPGGWARYDDSRWVKLDNDHLPFAAETAAAPAGRFDSLLAHVPRREMIRNAAERDGEIAVAAENGLFVGNAEGWQLTLPRDGHVRWAPLDVRAVDYDVEGRLWFACPQGVGFRIGQDKWKLFTGADGLPYNDFTCLAAGPRGVWLGTTNGAIRYHQGNWEFRQGGRWLADNHVRDVAVDQGGNAWLATAGGVSRIALEPTTLTEKAIFYEREIEKYNRRTKFGYVNSANLTAPGDKSTAVPVFSDNDGFNTGLYLAAMSLAYAATNEPKYALHADRAFGALGFLSEVTQGGAHPAPEGFIARNVIPTSEPDPNRQYDLAYDVRRNRADALWKVMRPRLPIDESGDFYWKCDSSSDELDGHFFGYACYYDHVCEADHQKTAVRQVVRRIIDHLLRHGYCLVDHDGRPTRWAHFSPDDLNRNEAWCDERGLNSYSILSYLSIAHHITGDERYRQAYMKLALDHGYGMNGMTQPKALPGPFSPGHQPDDNMAFMNYYHLIRYETDPKLLSMFHHAIDRHWQYERLERNAFANFVYAACCQGKTRRDQWGEQDLSPPPGCFTDAVDTLRRYPLDLVEWPMSNAHRIDRFKLGRRADGHPTIGRRVDGYAFPIDERHEIYWDWDPWQLTFEGQGLRLRPGTHYLLAYYLGRFHDFIGEF